MECGSKGSPAKAPAKTASLAKAVAKHAGLSVTARLGTELAARGQPSEETGSDGVENDEVAGGLQPVGRVHVRARQGLRAGVILATGFVHMMHDAEEKFQDPCLQDSPWRRFPFAGSIAMLASLVTLVVDFLGTQFYERKQREAAAAAATSAQEETAVALLEDGRNAGGEKREGAVHHGHGHGHGHENEAGPSQARQVVVSQAPRSTDRLLRGVEA
uniref:Zinc transporter 10 n=1 Tax=Aegilops tauschii TaxID=37682 RepID=R7W3B3_AEGTA